MRTFALQTPSYAVKKIKPQNKTTTNTNTNTSDFYGLDADTGEIKFMGGHQHLHDAEHDISAPNGRTQIVAQNRGGRGLRRHRCSASPIFRHALCEVVFVIASLIACMFSIIDVIVVVNPEEYD